MTGISLTIRMTDDQTDTSLLSRRPLLRNMGVSTAGAIAASREKIVDASDTATEDSAELRKQFGGLDKRSKLTLRLILVLSGFYLFLAT